MPIRAIWLARGITGAIQALAALALVRTCLVRGPVQAKTFALLTGDGRPYVSQSPVGGGPVAHRVPAAVEAAGHYVNPVYQPRARNIKEVKSRRGPGMGRVGWGGRLSAALKWAKGWG